MEGDKWVPQGSIDQKTEPMDPYCGGDMGEEWLSWAYDTTAALSLSDQQPNLQRDVPNGERPQGHAELDEQPDNQTPDWRGLVLGARSTWTNPSSPEQNIGNYIPSAGEHDSGQETLFSSRFHVPQVKTRPSNHSIPSSTSTSTAFSTELTRSPYNPGLVHFSSSSSTENNLQSDDILSRTLSGMRASETITPPSSVSRRGKRKSFTEDQEPSSPRDGQKLRTIQMAGHSVCEKRYRNKLNVKLAALRDRVPSLRVIPKQSEEYAYREGTEKLERPVASTKFDKATIVSKAIEYILYLEMCNKRLSEEDVALKDRVSAIQEIAMAHPHR